jgi:methylated-DNA-[protein]-cysteine S-methyltransferase
MALCIAHLQTPVGVFSIAAGKSGDIVAAGFENDGFVLADWLEARGHAICPDGRPCARALKQVREYFAGKRTAFELPLAPEGTEFQRRVWAELMKIPFGATKSYGQVAKALGDVGSIRAVGKANGANPIALLIPCHRVIGANGSLTGYAAGLEIKRFLLDFERKDTLF